MAQHSQPGWYGSANRFYNLDQELEAGTIAPADYPPQSLIYDQNMNCTNGWMGPPGGVGYSTPAFSLNTRPISGDLGNDPRATDLQDLQSLINVAHVPGVRISSNSLDSVRPSGSSNNYSSDHLTSEGAQAAPNSSAPSDQMSPIIDAIKRLKAEINRIQPPPNCKFDFYIKGLEGAVSNYAESQRKKITQNGQMASSFLIPPTSRSIESTIPYNSRRSNHEASSTLTFDDAQPYYHEFTSNRIPDMPDTIGQVPSVDSTIAFSRSPKRRRRLESLGDSKPDSLSGPRPKRTRLSVISKTGVDSQQTRFPCQSCKKSYPKLSCWQDHQSRVHLPTRVYVCLVCFREKPSGLGPSTRCRKKDNFKNHQIHLHGHNKDNGKITLKKEIKRCTVEVSGVFHDTCGYCRERLPDAKTSRKHIIQHMNDGKTRSWKHQCTQNHEEAIRKCVAAHLDIPEFDEDDPGQSDDDEDDFEGDSELPEGSDFEEDATFAPSSGRDSEGGSFTGNGGGRSAANGFSANANSAGGYHVHSCGEDTIADEIDMPLESKDVQSFYNALIPFQSLDAVRNLGSGGSGTVQEVFCSDSNQTFAMKTIQRHQFGLSDAQETAVFKNEVRIMRALRALRSPHLVEFICSYIREEQFSILMAPAAHTDLARYMRTAKTTPESQENLFRGVACLAAALKEIHSGSVVGRVAHHDLKPANILLGNGGTLILADFGLSKIDYGHSELTRATKVTPEYAPPEVIEQGLQSRASDVWSLGCIFTEIFTFCLGKSLSDFERYRSTLAGDKSFHKTWEKTKEWIDLLEKQEPMCCPGLTKPVMFDVTRQMISKNPKDRPTAYEIWLKLPKCTCPFDSKSDLSTRPQVSEVPAKRPSAGSGNKASNRDVKHQASSYHGLPPSDIGTSRLPARSDLNQDDSLPGLTRAISPRSSRSVSSGTGERQMDRGLRILIPGPDGALEPTPHLPLHRPDQDCILECPFSFINCFRRFAISNERQWFQHSLEHFRIGGRRPRKIDPPKSNSCCFCSAVFKASDGIVSWRDRMDHVKLHHTLAGHRLAAARLDFALIEYLWREGVLSLGDYRELKPNAAAASRSTQNIPTPHDLPPETGAVAVINENQHRGGDRRDRSCIGLEAKGQGISPNMMAGHSLARMKVSPRLEYTHSSEQLRRITLSPLARG